MSQFTGLPMPVFSAFGWAGQEAAVKYALSQLELFVNRLHIAMPQELQSMMPYFGVDSDSQTVYIGGSHKLEPEPYLTFQARPLSFEMTLHVTDEMYIGKMLSVAERQFDSWYSAVQQLGEDWQLRMQQMEVPEEGLPSHYQDLYKGPVQEFSRETAQEVVSRAVYLHGEEKWITPLYFTFRLHSDLVSGMGPAVVPGYRDRILQLLPLLQFIHTPRKAAATGRAPKAPKTRAPRNQVAPTPVAPLRPFSGTAATDGSTREEMFQFLAELKPLHIRKGFVNLEPRHWAYFTTGSRMETRPVAVRYGSKKDDESSVWHLMPDDQTRIVLGPMAQAWLEETFDANDQVVVTVYRVSGDKIEITLKRVES